MNDAVRPVSKQISTSDDVQDLSDFCDIWPQVRSEFVASIEKTKFENVDTRIKINWLVKLADKVYFDVE